MYSIENVLQTLNNIIYFYYVNIAFISYSGSIIEVKNAILNITLFKMNFTKVRFLKICI